MKTRSLVAALVLFGLIVFSSGPSSALEDGKIARSFEGREQPSGYPLDDDDLWVVNATVTETITKSGSFHSSRTTKITPDELVKASHVTIEKNNSFRSTKTGAAFISAVVSNEGADDILVISGATPVSIRVGGTVSQQSYASKLETVNGVTADYSSETEEGGFHINLTTASIEAEYSDGYKGVSIHASGEGEQHAARRRHENGAWKTPDPSRSKREEGVGFGASEDTGGIVTRIGDTIYANRTETTASREENIIYGTITTVARRTLTATFRRLSKEPPKADPGGPYEVERGGTLSLDGSRSRGNLISYQWKFAPAGGCPPDVQIAPGPKEGQSVDIVPLCPVTATLTVSDGKQSSSRSVTVSVKARDWKTPFEHIQAEGSLSPAVAPLIDPHLMAFSGGANVCSLDSSQDENHSFHPGEKNGTWDDSGYKLVQVTDPGGPFDNTWYVQEHKLRISRQTLMNPYLLPGGRPPMTGVDPWHDYNNAKGAPVAAYLKAVREHEMEHSNRKRAALPANDPAVKMEPLFGNDRDKLKEDLDNFIRDAELAVCEASQDPLPRTWRGTLWFPKIDTGIYMQGEVEVGGPHQIETPPCKR